MNAADSVLDITK